MSYVEQIISGAFKIKRRNKKRRIRGYWEGFRGWRREGFTLDEAHTDADKKITGFFRINRSRRLKVFLDDGDTIFNRKTDELLSTTKLKPNEHKCFKSFKAGRFDINYISWHIPMEFCETSKCYGAYYRALFIPENSDCYIPSIIDSEKSAILRESSLK